MHRYIIVLIVFGITICSGVWYALSQTSVSKERHDSALSTTSPKTLARLSEKENQKSPVVFGNTAIKKIEEAKNPASTGSNTQPLILDKKNQTLSLSDQDIEDARFKILSDAIIFRQETQKFLADSLADVSAVSDELFRKWASVIYRDSLMLGITRIDPADSVRLELMTAYSNDSELNIVILKKCKLGEIPEARTIALLTRVQEQRGQYSPEDASFIARESEYLLTKSIGRLHSHYMSNMKAVLSDTQVPIEEKIAYVRRFVAIADLEMAKYPLEYFEEITLNDPSLNSSQISMVDDLIKEIKN